MSRGRYPVMVLAPTRADWVGSVLSWAMSGMVPVDLIRCLSAEELRARLDSGTPCSAVILDASAGNVDRDLVARARHSGTTCLIVGPADRDWSEIGVHGVLDPGFGAEQLNQALREYCHSSPVEGIPAPSEPPVGRSRGPTGRLHCVLGTPGSGSSTLAAALAQSLADELATPGSVLLADLDLHSSQAALHDSADVIPGLQEMAEAHRLGRPSRQQVRDMTFAVPDRGYDLLLGVRRHRDWVALGASTIEAAIESLAAAYRETVLDTGSDLDDESTTGSHDIADRNSTTLVALRRAHSVVVVGRPGVAGLHRLFTLAAGLERLEVDPTRVSMVLNGAPRRRRARAEVLSALAELCPPGLRPAARRATAIPHIADLESRHSTVAPFPHRLTTPLARAVASLRPLPEPVAGSTDRPVPVVPGTLGHLGGGGLPA